MKTKPVLMAWGVDRSGHVYADGYVEVDVTKQEAYLMKGLFMRSRIQNTEVSLFHIPEEWGLEEVRTCVLNMGIKKLQEAKVTEKDIYVSFGPGSSEEHLKNHRDKLPLLLGLDPELDAKIEKVLKGISE